MLRLCTWFLRVLFDFATPMFRFGHSEWKTNWRQKPWPQAGSEVISTLRLKLALPVVLARNQSTTRYSLLE